ncbi:MAG: LysR family transcriptional regulator [Arhodomonas sp.]|nr:LysR family transcriptional regulator [Arhodomonas sp.]
MDYLPTELLRTFVLVAESEGFTRAGERLGRSQPAVSLQIKRLEALVGQSLLVRDGRQLRPTPAGETLLAYAQRILALNREALGRLHEPELAGTGTLGGAERVRQLLPARHPRQVRPGPPQRESRGHLRPEHSAPGPAGARRAGSGLRPPCRPRRHCRGRWWTRSWSGGEPLTYDAHEQVPVPLVVAPEGCVDRGASWPDSRRPG